ncbi:nucleoside monophosphate kinase [Mycoplasma iguanae]|uniref:Adenylate kinase n=1 Tax=Mycoplasma iguanae TaxID=292461 RepID=A0ABY5R935_9MOLU|nr:nucleoside monophosphate kinase [Mycoplasma iguanae]UVD81796.1 nucleoside monophosphate kinase [Mycoplasma iguanae]
MIIKNIIFLGAPGAGKGSVASYIAANYDFSHISTGDIFREQIKNKTPLGLELQQIVESGLYVPDSITNQIVADKLHDLSKKQQNFILDGYPRTIAQAQFLDETKIPIPFVVLLDVPQDVIVARLSQRRFCPTCNSTYHLVYKPSKRNELCELDDTKLIQRKDDQPEAIIQRLEVYEKQTKPLIDYYQAQGKLKIFNGDQTIEATAAQIIAEVIN